VAYLLGGTYYFVGLAITINAVLPIIFLFFGLWAVEMRFDDFLVHLVPFLFMFLLIHLSAQIWMRDRRERGLQWRGMLLKMGTWPIYVLALILTLLRREVPYLPTPKTRQLEGFSLLILPHIAVVLLSVLASIWALNSPLADFGGTRLMIFFAGLNVLMMLPTILVGIKEATMARRRTL
jgi:hypothetical protein